MYVHLKAKRMQETQREDVDCDSETLSPNVSYEFDKGVLKAHKLDLQREAEWEVVCDKWQRSFPLRLRELGTLSRLHFFNDWPKYTDARSASLINIDFDIIYPRKGHLLKEKWTDFKEKITRFYCFNVTNKSSKSMLKAALESQNLDVQDNVLETLLNSVLQSPARSFGKREKKVSVEQKEIYCSFLEGNTILAKRKHCDASVQGLWQKLTCSLNSTGGAQHSCDKWKTVFDKKTGGGPPTAKNNLERLEERAMACWGPIVVEGHSQVGVAGCSNLLDVDAASKVPAQGSVLDTDTPHIIELDANIAQCEELGDICLIPDVIIEERADLGSAQKNKRPRRSAAQHLDNDLNNMLETSEANRQAQADAIISRLDKIAVAIEKMTEAQMATAAAIQKFAEALSSHA